MIALRCRLRGFTMIETMLGIVFASLLIGAVIRLTATTDALSRETRGHTRASAEHRRAHESLRAVLANVDLDTLSGFDVGGVATHPKFQCVTGIVDGALVHAAEESLEWHADILEAADLKQAGHVTWTDSDGVDHVLLARVLKNGFSLRQEGRNLVIRLTTYHGPNPQDRVFLTSESVLSLRN